MPTPGARTKVKKCTASKVADTRVMAGADLVTGRNITVMRQVAQNVAMETGMVVHTVVDGRGAARRAMCCWMRF